MLMNILIIMSGNELFLYYCSYMSYNSYAHEHLNNSRIILTKIATYWQLSKLHIRLRPNSDSNVATSPSFYEFFLMRSHAVYSSE